MDSEELSRVVIEAERILLESATSDGQAASWLRNSEHWPGSMVRIERDGFGRITEATVTVSTANPYKLRALLRWLGVPRPLIGEITGLER